ncbi:MAG: GyrI-like domain-containing protein [Chloroflexi bacterium]|uniref:GyrI-like domain-containing protein n=1 Tax=Candidatus Chlorohelix allophototropha TaxID=3003348 RepID=A0A8T7LW23_9CHLR|nr:GyrI-like domain-containing protein [Chloroflexota bacterium]WJW66992.1 GyrI-like domain-containing protein [Chloroflexota bacterium L227-S17]
MGLTCGLEELAAQPVLSMRTRTSAQELPQFFGKAYGMVFQYLSKLNAPPAGPPFAMYYNMDMQNLDVEAGFPVSKPLAGEGEFIANEIAAGKYATCLYKGSYQEVGSAYETLSTWIKENGYTPTGIACEMYLNDPADTPPEQLLTKVMFQLLP